MFGSRSDICSMTQRDLYMVFKQRSEIAGGIQQEKVGLKILVLHLQGLIRSLHHITFL